MIKRGRELCLYKIAVFLQLPVDTGRYAEILGKAIGVMAVVMEPKRMGYFAYRPAFQQQFFCFSEFIEHDVCLRGNAFSLFKRANEMVLAHPEPASQPGSVDGFISTGFDDLIYFVEIAFQSVPIKRGSRETGQLYQRVFPGDGFMMVPVKQGLETGKQLLVVNDTIKCQYLFALIEVSEDIGVDIDRLITVSGFT